MSADQAPTYFISDLHLEASRPRVTEAFNKFLTTTAKGARALYILGDLVDSWVGDDDNSAHIQHLRAMLSQCVSSGTRVFFIHGNRDFMIGRKFSTDTGVKILDETTLIDLYGEKVLLLHGDSLCTDDEAYQKFRKKVRNPAWQAKTLRYPLWTRKILAAYFRARSKKANSNKSEYILDVSQTAVEESFKRFAVTKMIHGHTHRPNTHQFEIDGIEHTRIVLGDWESHGWYIRADKHGQELVKFEI